LPYGRAVFDPERCSRPGCGIRAYCALAKHHALPLGLLQARHNALTDHAALQFGETAAICTMGGAMSVVASMSSAPLSFSSSPKTRGTPVMTETATSSSDPTHPLVESNHIEGTAVYDSNGKRIGKIRRLVIEKVSGHVVYAVTAFGGFLGLEAEIHTIPWEQLHYDTARGGYKTTITKAQFQSAPEFSRHDENLLSHYQRKELNEYYRIPPPG
jgi:sporulation protein YlmC with PRC-barrel domain